MKSPKGVLVMDKEKSLASRYGQYLNKNFGLSDLKKGSKKSKSLKKHSKLKASALLNTVDNYASKTQHKKSLPLMLYPKEKPPNKESTLSNKPGAEPKININFEIKNLNIFKSSAVSSLKKGHRKQITNLQPQKQLQSDIKRGKIRLKASVDPVSPKLHRKAKSQDIQIVKGFDPNKFLEQEPDKSNIAKHAASSRAGMLEDRPKTNQDAYRCIPRFILNDTSLYAVFDGHGINGHFVSEFVKEILPQNIEYYSIRSKLFLKQPTNEQLEGVLKQAFKKTTLDLQRSQIDIMFSGTTAVLAFLTQNRLYCANIGDSRAIICSQHENEWRATPLSTDHKADVPTEATRILKNRGRLEAYLSR